MNPKTLDAKFEAYLARDDDALLGSQFFETLAEIEKRHPPQTIEVTLHVVEGQVKFEPSPQIRAHGKREVRQPLCERRAPSRCPKVAGTLRVPSPSTFP